MFARNATRAMKQASRAFTTAAVRPSSARVAIAGAVAASAAAAFAFSQTNALATAHAAPAVTASGKIIPPHGIHGTQYERSFLAIKPDGVQRGLIAKIIARFEEKGFKLVAMKLVIPTKEVAAGHYEDLSKKPFFPALCNFFSSGPIVAMVWEGKGVVATGRRLLGETDPAKSLPGSIRGDYSIDIGRNIMHGSDGQEGAEHEINFWFKPEEICNWNPTANQHIYESQQ